MPMSEFHEQTEVQQLAEFIARADIQDISPEALWQLKIRVLDTLGVAIGALEAEPIIAIKGLLEDLGGTPQSTMIGGGKTSPERAARSEFHEQTEVQQLAEFIARADIQDISPEALWQLKIRVLDTLGVAIGALEAEPIIAIKGLLEDLGGTPQSTMIGGGKTSPERAAFYNSALSRYLDFM